MSTRALYRYEFDVPRHGCIEHLFVATDEQIKANEGKKLVFGEMLGKFTIKGQEAAAFRFY